MDGHRSGCPINLTLEVLEIVSLIVVRDVMFGNRRFRELLTLSEERIASNVLPKDSAAVGRRPAVQGGRTPATAKRDLQPQRAAIQLVPLLASMGKRGRRHTPVSRELSSVRSCSRKGPAPVGGLDVGAARHSPGAQSRFIVLERLSGLPESLAAAR